MRTRLTSFALALCVAALLPQAAHAVELRSALNLDMGLLHTSGVTPEPHFTYKAFPYLGFGGQVAAGLLVAGVEGDLAHDVFFGRTETFGHVFLGLEAASPKGSVSLAGELGGHRYSSVGTSFAGLYDSPSRNLPSVGGHLRFGLTHYGGARIAGLSMFIRHDREETNITAVHLKTDSIFDYGNEPTVDYHLGGTTVGVAVDIAFLGPTGS